MKVKVNIETIQEPQFTWISLPELPELEILTSDTILFQTKTQEVVRIKIRDSLLSNQKNKSFVGLI